MGFTGFLLGFTGFYCVFRGFTGFTGFYWVLLGYYWVTTRFYFLSFAEFYRHLLFFSSTFIKYFLLFGSISKLYRGSKDYFIRF